MKKFRLISALLMLFGLTATAQESISVNEVLIAPGKQAMMEVMFHFNENHDYVSYQFKVNLPDGISFVADDDNQVIVELGDGQPTARFSTEMPVSSAIMKAYSSPSTVIATNEGVLVKIAIMADEAIEQTAELTGTITGVVFANSGATAFSFPDANINIKMTEKIILDENYTWEPFATEDEVDIEVKRTINANEWSTICLPFDMDEDQITTIFGSDVQLMELPTGKKDTPFDFETDADNNVTSITINFVEVDIEEDGFTANTPYLIKTSKNITEFTTTVAIDPDEVIASWSKGSGASKKAIDFIGTYKAGTVVPENSLFLNGNKFYYSTGKTKMKGYRAYFTINKVLADAINAGTKVMLNIGGETTDIESVNWSGDDGRYYDLQGRPVQNPSKKGLYINNGKKAVVK